MTADSMLAHAKYGIAQMREGSEFDFHFRARLASLKSVLDHLLEEYNQKFDLGIGRETNLNVKRFRGAAKADGNEDAQKFIEDFGKERELLLEDKIVWLLLRTHG